MASIQLVMAMALDGFLPEELAKTVWNYCSDFSSITW